MSTPPAHFCSTGCRHFCHEAGGRTRHGRPCRNLGQQGIPGGHRGHFGLCVKHDPAYKTPKQARDLPPRWRKFVLAYCGPANCNITEAAWAAGLGVTRASAAARGSQLMKEPRIQRAISQWWHEMAAPAEEVIARMTAFSRGSLMPLVQFLPDGSAVTTLTPELVEQYGHLIKEIVTDEETGRITKVRLHDALAATRDLAKIHQLYNDSPVHLHLSVARLSDAEILQELGSAPVPTAEGAGTNGNGKGRVGG